MEGDKLKSIFQIFLNIIKFILWLMFNRIMALPVLISYMFVTKSPSLTFQIIIMFLGVILGIITTKILYIIYKKRIIKHNPLNLEDHVSINKSNILTWVKIIILSVIMILGKFIFEHNFMDGGNSNTIATNSVFDSYSISFFLLLVLFGPLCEELTVRGLFFSYFNISDGKFSKIVMIIINGLLFMALHGSLNDPSAIQYFVVGIILSIVFIKTKNIQYSSFIHVMLNLSAEILGILNI